MEKFKACEKEMKTKAFSKEGLIAALRLDPKEKEKLETTSWISNQVDELSRQIEQAEAEIETLQGGVKKKGKNGSTHGRLEELEAQNDRRKWHIGRLEIILRMIENGTLPVEDVLPLKDDISYFVDNNAVREAPYSILLNSLYRTYRMKNSTTMRVSTTTSTWTTLSPTMWRANMNQMMELKVYPLPHSTLSLLTMFNRLPSSNINEGYTKREIKCR